MKTLFAPLRGVRITNAAVTDDGKEFNLECDDGQMIRLVRPEANRVNNLVDAVLLVDKSSLHYKIELSANDARKFLERAEPYNYIPKNLSDIVNFILNAIGPMNYGLCNGRPNPNNGSFSHIRISVGNEGSRVIYVKSHRTTNSDPLKVIFSRLEAIGMKFHADENEGEVETLMGTEYFTWRFWWD